MSSRWLLAALVAVFYLLHQDIWFWRETRPIVFGVLPIGLFYHAAYTLGVSGLVWILIRAAWPAHLDETSPSPRRSLGRSRGEGRGEGQIGGSRR